MTVPFDDNPYSRVWDTYSVPGAGAYTSAPLVTPFGHIVSFTVVITGTVYGTMTVEVSNATDNDVQQGLDNDWQTYSGVSNPTALPAITGAGTIGVGLIDVEYARVRLKLVVTSGSGTLVGRAMCKSKGWP